MKTYIGVKMIKAKPMTLGDYNTHRGCTIPADEDPAAPGYLVEYEDGYQSWSPGEAFKAYMEIDDPTRITAADIDRFIGRNAFTDQKIGDKSTLVTMTPRTGFVQHEISSCVDPANYDHAVGVSIANGRLREGLWPFLGFVLQWARYGLRPVAKD